MLITFLCLLFNFHFQNILVRAVNLPTHRNVISTQPARVFCIMPLTFHKHICHTCNKTFLALQKKAKYCTHQCYTKSRFNYHKETRNCIVCNKEFKVFNYVIKRGNDAGKFCSQYCVNSYRTSNKNPNWRGGDIYDKVKKNAELKKLRPIIREKYNYTCQKCGDKGANVILDVHHIIPYRLTQDNSLNNLTLLCHSCHMQEAKKELKLFK